MIGILLGLGSAIFNATWNTLIGALNKKSSQLQVAMYNCLFAFLFILPFLIGQGLNVKSNIFWLVLVVFVIIDSIAMLLYIKAIHISGVSKTVPLLSFTPVLVILIGFVFLKEIPTLIAVLGVLLVILGAYFLNIKQYNLGFFEPILEIFKDKGTKYMFIVAVLFAIDAMLFKLGQIYSDQLTIVSMYLLFEGLIFFAVINYNKKQKKKSIKLDFKTLVTLLLLAAVGLLSDVSFAFAMDQILVGYVVALKRTTILFSVIFGFIFLKEKNIKEKLFGSIIMIIGVVLIALYGA